MTAFRRLALVVVILVLIGGAGVGWYLFGSNGKPAAGLVPGDTLAFALIPNGVSVKAGYDGSKLRQIVDAPQAQPLFDLIEKTIGDKNLALIKLLAPELSGQSFLALTHFDPAHPDATGFVAGLRPKLGMDHFDEFVQQVKASYPDLAKETKTGHDTLLGVDYQWIEGTHAPGRICVARTQGWIVTTWGVPALQDFLERLQGKSSTPSLADNDDFKKTRDRVGPSPQALVYGTYGTVIDYVTKQLATSNAAMAAQLKQRLGGIGGAAIGTSFSNGEIVDRFFLTEPKAMQIASGLSAQPCAFDTLKFTGPDTRMYVGANVDWQQLWKNYQDQIAAMPAATGKSMMDAINEAGQAVGIDIQKNLINALGQEYSVQLEWAADAQWPDVAVYLKIDKPDDFKPVTTAIINEARKDFAASAVINEMESNGHHFATLKMINPMPVSPTITEDGPYFAVFLNESHAVRSLARDESRGLLHNDDFNRQIGSQRNGASHLVFLDTPKLLDQTYRTALPWVNMAAMFNPKVAGVLQNQKLPPDLAWLAPMGTWAAVSRSEDDGVTGFSTSGAGNQGVVIVGALVATALDLQKAGIFPQTPSMPPAAVGTPPSPVVPPPPNAPAGAPASTVPPAVSTPAAPPAPVVPSNPPVPPIPPDAPGSTH